ncbi:MAG: glycosyltransferase family 2 protein [Acetobacteraceae bacterium]
MPNRSQPVSACVVTFNRSAIVGTCLHAARFADELIVVDKSSTDGTRQVARRLADRVVTVPWSPTVEETRAHAVSLCRHDWILLLDDDECLNPDAVRFIRRELADPSADIYAFPLRHYILGRHDERAYYWPEHHVRLFRRGSVAFGGTVHAGMTLLSNRIMHIAADAGPCIHHLSHPDVAGWIERTNRYTGRPYRARVEGDGKDLVTFAHGRIDHWLANTRDAHADPYLQAVALLRAVYDITDRLKTWEEMDGADGAARFRQICAEIEAAHRAQGTSRKPSRPAQRAANWLRRILHQFRSALPPRPRAVSRPAFPHPRE